MFLVQCEELRINHRTPLLVVRMLYACWLVWWADYIEDFKWRLRFQSRVAFWRVVLREVYFEGPNRVRRAVKTSIVNTDSLPPFSLSRVHSKWFELWKTNTTIALRRTLTYKEPCWRVKETQLNRNWRNRSNKESRGMTATPTRLRNQASTWCKRRMTLHRGRLVCRVKYHCIEKQNWNQDIETQWRVVFKEDQKGDRLRDKWSQFVVFFKKNKLFII